MPIEALPFNAVGSGQKAEGCRRWLADSRRWIAVCGQSAAGKAEKEESNSRFEIQNSKFIIALAPGVAFQ
jgi:hypothetical protein